MNGSQVSRAVHSVELDVSEVPDLSAFMKQLRADAQRLNFEIHTRINGTHVIVEASPEALAALFEPGWRG